MIQTTKKGEHMCVVDYVDLVKKSIKPADEKVMLGFEEAIKKITKEYGERLVRKF